MKREKEQERKEKEKQGMFWASMICFISFVSFYLHLEEILGRMGIEYRSWAVIGGKILFWALFAWLALSAVRYKRLGRSERGPLITGILLIAFLAGAGGFAGLTKSSLIRPVERESEEAGLLKVQAEGEEKAEAFVPVMGVFRISQDNLEALKNKGHTGIYAVLDNLPFDRKQEDTQEEIPEESPSENGTGTYDPDQTAPAPDEAPEIDEDSDYEMERQMEAAKLIYDQCLKDKGYTYAEGVNAKGEWYIDVGDGKRLIYDRMSKNGKCYLFALNGADYSSLEDYYAVNLDTKEVIATGKHSYSQSGGEAYYKATGEY